MRTSPDNEAWLAPAGPHATPLLQITPVQLTYLTARQAVRAWISRRRPGGRW
jgi:hypothetical protein